MYKLKKILLTGRSVLFYTLAQFLWPLLIVSCGIFLTYRKIVDTVLRKKLGHKYGGLLETADSIMITNDSNKFIITSVLIAKSDVERDIFKIAKERLKNKVFDYPHNYPKLTSTQHVFGGYPYWISDDYKLDDCLKILSTPDDKFFDEEYLKELTGKITSKPFSKNNTGLWDVAVSQKPLQCKKNDGFFYYPIIVRFNHAIGDGTSLMALLIKIVGDKYVENYNTKIFQKLFKQTSRNDVDSKASYRVLVSLKKMLSFLALCFYIIFIGLGKAIKSSNLGEDDHSALHGPEPSGEKIVAWHVEDEVKYIPLVKRIKNRVPNTKFSKVIMAAVSASLTSFFDRNCLPIPKKIKTVLTVLLHVPALGKIKPIKLENKTTLMVFDLPLNTSNSLTKLLEDVKEKGKDVKYGDVLVHKFIISKVVGLFPMSIKTKLEGPGLQTSVITNIPGGSQVPILDGSVMDKVIPIAPNIKKTGISISILSYDDRFQIGILVDKAILSSQQEVQRIADDIFTNIKLLDKETEKVYNND